MNHEPSLPRRVLRWLATNREVHNDCLLAADPCKACRDHVMQALETVYAPYALDEASVIAAITADFHSDMVADEEERRG